MTAPLAETAPNSDGVALRVSGVSKAFPGVQALRDVQLEVARGEIHALVGENGAGKSTLMRILYGVHQPDTGTIALDGRPVTISSPHDAQRLGLSMVHQELNLVPFLDIGRNIYLGREPRLGFGPLLVDWPRLYREAAALLARLNIRLNSRTPVRRLSVAQAQMVEIAKALSWQPALLILDEPTSSLTQSEIGELFRILRTLRAEGVAILYISHRLEELGEIADRVTVMRDGQYIATVPARTPIPELIRMMVGRSLEQQFLKEPIVLGDEVLTVQGLRRAGVVREVSFAVRAGEIVGMAGLIGAGRTEVARVLFGADAKDGGEVRVGGRRVRIRSPRDAIKAGIGLLPEDRKTQGLVLPLAIRNNVSLATLDRLAYLGVVVDHGQREALARRSVRELRIRTPGTGFRTRNLSGGNQQKVVLAKWLAARPRVLIFDEPTRGIDVGAKVEVYHLMTDLAKQGVGILMISSELPELLGMCDRILVMRAGRLVADLPRAEATQETIIAYASGEA